MSKYIFDTHYGVSTLTDTENDVMVSWHNGQFNESQKMSFPDDEKDVMRMARIAREMADYIAENYQELV